MRDGPHRVAALEGRQDLRKAVPRRKAGRVAVICILTGRVWVTD